MEGKPPQVKYTGGVTAGPIPGLPTPVNPEPNKWFEPDLQSKVNPLILVEAKAVKKLDTRGRDQLKAFVDYAAQSTPKGVVFVVTTSDVSFAENPGTAVVTAANAATKKVPLYQSFAQVKSKCEKGKWLFEFRVNTADKLGTTAAATSPLGSPSPVVKIEKR